MSEAQHDLHSLFPDDTDTLTKLKLAGGHFDQLSQRHHDLEKEIARIDAGLDAASDERVDGLKRDRLHLLDEIAATVAAARE